MKWIKTAIGALIAVLTIGIIATTVFKMTQPSEVLREVSFEIDPEEGKYYPLSAYNEILEYGVIDMYDGYDDYGEAINLVSSYLNNEIIKITLKVDFREGIDWIYFEGEILIPDNIIIDSYIDSDGNWFDDGSTLTDIVNINLVFEVSQPPQFSGITATLIVLIPLVFVGGVLLYFYKPLKKE